MNDAEVPEWENVDGWHRAICKPDGYCRDGHRCGKLDLGITRNPSPSLHIAIPRSRWDRFLSWLGFDRSIRAESSCLSFGNMEYRPTAEDVDE